MQYYDSPQRNVSDLIGLTFSSVVVSGDKDQIVLTSVDGREFVFYHSQDCCEQVLIEEIHGDLHDLENSPILDASESTNSDDPEPHEYVDSFTWTFYKFTTIKGTVTIRWLGESNGYYSESVDLVENIKS